AKTQSQDTDSAAQGGDLGAIEKGNYPVKEIEETVFKLKDGEVSGIVASEFGYHIIKVTSVKPSVQKPLDAARADIS
ncbi:peptidylprolyl isomerase, partial [Escherichia coli]|uniref:peptidylprolyl isomerase n=2 Tax=Pseudomonadota TaxID=1224 RepID=UPI001964BC26